MTDDQSASIGTVRKSCGGVPLPHGLLTMKSAIHRLIHDWALVRSHLDCASAELGRGIGSVPPLIAQRLLVSGEDHRHVLHPGVDPIAICRATWRCIYRGKREGASTIEQQVVRVISGRYE